MPLILSVWPLPEPRTMPGMGQSPLTPYFLVQRHSTLSSRRKPGPMAATVMFFVYLLASQPQGTLYVGVTSDLAQGVWQHKSKAVPGFTSKYGVDRLAWFEAHELWESAIRREKQIKEWKRAWKIQLIKPDNPHWIDIYDTLTACARAG